MKEPRLSLSSPEKNGWFYKEGVLKPKLMNQEEVSASCLQLACCGCSSGNSCINRRCTCVRMSLSLDAPRVASVETRAETQETFHWTKKRCNVLCAAYVVATADFCYSFYFMIDTNKKPGVVAQCI